MGCYINPRTESKEAFLHREGTPMMTAPTATDINANAVPVCLVDNGTFTAAGVAFSPRELEAFTRYDGRFKQWFMVPRTALYQVSDLKNYE